MCGGMLIPHPHPELQEESPWQRGSREGHFHQGNRLAGPRKGGASHLAEGPGKRGLKDL